MGQRHKTLSSETHTHQHLTHVAAGFGFFFFFSPDVCVRGQKRGREGRERAALKDYNSSLKRTSRPPPSSRSLLSSSPTRRVSMSYTSE